MRVHSDIKINRIKELRRAGFSINDIVRALEVPKTTVWHHIRHEIMPQDLKAILQARRGGSTDRSRKHWAEAELKAVEILAGEQSKLAIAAAMLYWGEGGKKSAI